VAIWDQSTETSTRVNVIWENYSSSHAWLLSCDGPVLTREGGATKRNDRGRAVDDIGQHVGCNPYPPAPTDQLYSSTSDYSRLASVNEGDVTTFRSWTKFPYTGRSRGANPAGGRTHVVIRKTYPTLYVVRQSTWGFGLVWFLLRPCQHVDGFNYGRSVTNLSPHRQTDLGSQRPVFPGGHPSKY